MHNHTFAKVNNNATHKFSAQGSNAIWKSLTKSDTANLDIQPPVWVSAATSPKSTSNGQWFPPCVGMAKQSHQTSSAIPQQNWRVTASGTAQHIANGLEKFLVHLLHGNRDPVVDFANWSLGNDSDMSAHRLDQSSKLPPKPIPATSVKTSDQCRDSWK